MRNAYEIAYFYKMLNESNKNENTILIIFIISFAIILYLLLTNKN